MLSAVARGWMMKSPQPRLKDRRFLVSWWKAVSLGGPPSAAKRVKLAVPELSTFMQWKRDEGPLGRKAGGTIAFAGSLTAQHSPAEQQLGHHM